MGTLLFLKILKYEAITKKKKIGKLCEAIKYVNCSMMFFHMKIVIILKIELLHIRLLTNKIFL